MADLLAIFGSWKCAHYPLLPVSSIHDYRFNGSMSAPHCLKANGVKTIANQKEPKQPPAPHSARFTRSASELTFWSATYEPNVQLLLNR